MMGPIRRICALALALIALGGCGQSGQQAADTPAGGTAFVLGDISFSSEHEEYGVDPHVGYSGWACIRYGVGETLFRYTDGMEPEPWLASSYRLVDDCTWEITLREGITFSSGRALDGQAVKECLEHLLQVHDRARGDLKIASIAAQGQTVTITTTQPHAALLSYLGDPYCCIVDLQAAPGEGLAVGTGPYIARSVEQDRQLELERNPHYWDGQPGYDRVTVLSVPDGDTLAMALQAGEVDAAYGIPYASYPLFQNENYVISSTPTSRAFFATLNLRSPLLQDPALRQAIALGIDKERFVEELLGGNGYPAAGPFPAEFTAGGPTPQAPAYDPQAAQALLEQAGWVDADGDGVREKDGQRLTLRWLTYTSRAELPLLAQAAQASLGQLGFEVVIDTTSNTQGVLSDPSAWEIYGSAMVTAPTGDPAYFFAAHCLDSSPANSGGYHSGQLEQLAAQLAAAFDPQERAALAGQMQQLLLEDGAFVFCSHLQMSLIAQADVAGLAAHPSDFYEITAALAPVS